MWLPLNWAVTLPAIHLSDIETIFAANPAAIKAHTHQTRKLNPCHLAAMMKNPPRLEIIRRLQIYYPLFGSTLDGDASAPIHLAAIYSNSVAMVRELAQLYPAVLEMSTARGNTPLHCAAIDSGSVQVVRELAQLYPAALEMRNSFGYTPLHLAAQYSNSVEIVRLLVSLSLVNNPDDYGRLPIHIAAQRAPLDFLKVIAEENMSNLSAKEDLNGRSVAHLAVVSHHLDNLRYIHAVMPELLLSLDDLNRTPLHALINDDGSLDDLDLSVPLSTASDVLRFLLRHCPSLASARDSNGLTLYDRLTADDDRLAYARRLLLLAGASSLYPGVLQEMNYAARRTALLVFYSSATEPSIFTRIRLAAGDKSLIRSIVSFL